jgi:hypothetical protein
MTIFATREEDPSHVARHSATSTVRTAAVEGFRPACFAALRAFPALLGLNLLFQVATSALLRPHKMKSAADRALASIPTTTTRSRPVSSMTAAWTVVPPLNK